LGAELSLRRGRVWRHVDAGLAMSTSARSPPDAGRL
jgi:hypothetical protein